MSSEQTVDSNRKVSGDIKKIFWGLTRTANLLIITRK